MGYQRVARAMLIACVLTAWFPSGGAVVAAASFTPLGVSGVSGISADGSTLFGSAGRWTTASGWQDLGALPGATQTGGAQAVSADGSVVVGTSLNSAGRNEAFRWTAASGKVGLGFLPGATFSDAQGVSADGSVIAGFAGPDAAGAARWTAASGWTLLPGFPGIPTNQFVRAWGISADGARILGDAVNGGPVTPVYWSADGALTQISPAEGSATGASADGSVIIGYTESIPSTQGFRWTAAGGMVSIEGDGTIQTSSLPNAISADGSVIVGRFTQRLPTLTIAAIVWDPAHGMRRLDEVLTAGGVDLTGWSLTNATGLSADGRTVIGTGTNPAGATESWMATIPEPGTTAAAILLAATATAARRPRRASTTGSLAR